MSADQRLKQTHFRTRAGSQAGFTLLSVLFGLALTLMGATALMTTTNSTLKDKTNLDLRYEKTDFENGVRTQIYGDRTCLCHFRGRRFRDTPAGLQTGLSLQAFPFFNDDCSTQMPLAQVGQPIDPTNPLLRTASISLSEGYPRSSSMHIFQLTIGIQSNSSIAISPVKVPHVTVISRSVGGGEREVVSCGVRSVDLSQAVSVEPGGAVMDAAGRRITFTNIRGVPISNAVIVNQDSRSMVVQLYNNLSSRRGYARVNFDPATGAFVNATQAPGYHPYLCFQPATSRGVCQLTAPDINCSSPIYFYQDGRIMGSLGGIQEPAESSPCGTVHIPAAARAQFVRY